MFEYTSEMHFPPYSFKIFPITMESEPGFCDLIEKVFKKANILKKQFKTFSPTRRKSCFNFEV